jgi:transcription-repair coupling factor
MFELPEIKKFITQLNRNNGNGTGAVLLTGLPPFLHSIGADYIAETLGSNIPFISLEAGDEPTKRVDELLSGESESLLLQVGEVYNFTKMFTNLGYTRVSRVWEPGEFSLYGDVSVIWPKGADHPYRISVFGDEIERISKVDTDTRELVSDVEKLSLSDEAFDQLGRYIVGEVEGGGELQESPIWVNFTDLSSIELEELNYPVLDFGFRRLPISEIHKGNFDGVRALLEQLGRQDYSVILLLNKKNDIDNLPEDFKGSFSIVNPENYGWEVHRGWISSRSRQVFLTPFELFGKLDIDEMIVDSGGTSSKMMQEDLLKKIQPGDYVVHEDHGVGLYDGLIDKNDTLSLELHYADKDKLFLPVTQVKKVTKYIGSGRKVPKLTRLNSGAWRRIRAKVDEDTEKLAKELLQIYAVRRASQGVAPGFDSADLDSLYSFIESFEYTDTEDQHAATEDIINDLSRGIPMDRLLVGDVGFGKTEVALRAVYAVASQGYQVAILAPTTILVQQHHEVIKDRFKDTGLEIDYLSRFRNAGETDTTKELLKSGDIDIVVGTHSLLSKDVKFDNLGLIVIDEEQKFGVKHKEHLKSKRIDVHVLTMSATPIPRTLNMALAGIRDISIIATPPHGRKPIKNYFSKFDEEKVKKALEQELERSGQAYFLHNKVSDIVKYKTVIERLIPDARVEVAHGQMAPAKLAEVMQKFAAKEIDILVCTTIIENGIDLPNVNTLIIDRAEMFGLSQLYQIRGRIGRSDRQAYSYFLYRNLPGNASERMDALAESEELGSGFLLANRDLEIRGAGNILGREQSGSIDSVGYGLFMRMLEEKVEKLRGN